MGSQNSHVFKINQIAVQPHREAVQYNQQQREAVEYLKTFDYTYNAIVLEGGGAKAAGHIGGLQVLKDVGILDQVNRFAGTSAGALIAACLALKHDPLDVRRIHESMKRAWFMDADGGHCAFLPNILSKLGWNPGRRVMSIMHQVIYDTIGKPDVTFMEVYKRFGTELCVVAANLSTMCLEYYHPKLSPNMSLVTALRSSISIPILLQPVQVDGSYLVDGGLLCNFPLHVFDGWGLSMEPEDSFFARLDSSEDPFGNYNDKVLGFMVKNAHDKLLMRQPSVDGNHHLTTFDSPYFPDTKLARIRQQKLSKQKDHMYQQRRLLDAGHRFASTGRSAGWTPEGACKIDDLRAAFKKVSVKNSFDDDDAEVLFGPGASMDKIINEMVEENMADQNGNVTFDDFIRHLRTKGVAFRSFFMGSMMAEISSFSDIIRVMLDTMAGHSRMYFQKDEDNERTVTINVGYIQTTDFEMQHADREFLVQQGANATIQHLKEKVRKHLDNNTRNLVTSIKL